MFLRNAWYPAGWSKDLTSEPVARKMLDEPIVLYRLPSGQLVALEDRCCHRAAPLSLGKVVGEHLQCGYHGLKIRQQRALRRGAGPEGHSARVGRAQLRGARKMADGMDLDGRGGTRR